MLCVFVPSVEFAINFSRNTQLLARPIGVREDADTEFFFGWITKNQDPSDCLIIVPPDDFAVHQLARIDEFCDSFSEVGNQSEKQSVANFLSNKKDTQQRITGRDILEKIAYFNQEYLEIEDAFAKGYFFD